MVRKVFLFQRVRTIAAGLVMFAAGSGLTGLGYAQSDNAPWRKICSPAAQEPSAPAKPTCRIVQQLYLNKKGEDGTQKTAGRLLGLAVFHQKDPATKKRITYLIVQTPLGVDLRRGAVLKVDEGQDVPLQYIQCTGAGCDAGLELAAPLLQAFKKGNRLLVGFQPLTTSKVAVVEASR